MAQDSFSLKEGYVVLNYPAEMSPESYGDFEEWVHLVLRVAKRRSEHTKASTKADDA